MFSEGSPEKNSIFGLKMRMLVHSPVQKVFRSGIDPTGTYPVLFFCVEAGEFFGGKTEVWGPEGQLLTLLCIS